MLRHALPVLAVVSGLLASRVAAAADHAAIAPYLTSDVVDVALIDLQKVDLPAVVEQLSKWRILSEPERNDARKEAASLQAALAELPKHGARRAYALIRARDVFEGGPAWLIQLEDEQQSQAAIDVLKTWISGAEQLGDAAKFLPKHVAADGKFVVAAASQERLTSLTKHHEASPRPDVLEALSAAGDSDVSLVMVGDRDTRRVVREMFPQMPPPFADIDGKLLVDGLKSIAISLKLPPDPTITLALETTGKDLAAKLEQSFENALTIAKGLLMAHMVSGPVNHKRDALEILPLLPLLTFQNDDARLTLTFGDDEQEKTFLRNMVPVMVGQAQTKAHLNTRLNKFKEMAIAMHNYASSAGRDAFPAQGTLDSNNRPLLSWRVQLLPFLGSSAARELYKQFHLDEPWDSEHNRGLIAKMPEVYADPDAAVRNAIEPGRTTFVLPVGEQFLFHGAAAPKPREIKDGSSNTILIVEVAPDRAVVWTKPEDWEVDLQDPLSGVKRSDREFFTAAFADGHVQLLQNSIDPKVFAGLLTASGGEKVSPP